MKQQQFSIRRGIGLQSSSREQRSPVQKSFESRQICGLNTIGGEDLQICLDELRAKLRQKDQRIASLSKALDDQKNDLKMKYEYLLHQQMKLEREKIRDSILSNFEGEMGREINRLKLLYDQSQTTILNERREHVQKIALLIKELNEARQNKEPEPKRIPPLTIRNNNGPKLDDYIRDNSMNLSESRSGVVRELRVRNRDLQNEIASLNNHIQLLKSHKESLQEVLRKKDLELDQIYQPSNSSRFAQMSSICVEELQKNAYTGTSRFSISIQDKENIQQPYELINRARSLSPPGLKNDIQGKFRRAPLKELLVQAP